MRRRGVVRWRCCSVAAPWTHLDLMLLKFLPSDRCLIERFLASHTSRVLRSESRPAAGNTQAASAPPTHSAPPTTPPSLHELRPPLSEMSRLVMLGISATQPSRIWEPPERS